MKLLLSLSQSENRQNQQNPAGKFSILLRRFFRLKPKKAAKLPEEGSLTAFYRRKSLPKPPDSGGDSNGKSLRSAGFKTSISDDTTIKNWPTVKSANQCGCGDRTWTCDLRVMRDAALLRRVLLLFFDFSGHNDNVSVAWNVKIGCTLFLQLVLGFTDKQRTIYHSDLPLYRVLGWK